MAAIDRYEILELLGTGGMGKVYKARDTVMDRIVALKVLQDNCIAEDSRRTRFDREGVLLSSLRHEHIVLFYAFGLRPDGAPQISMEYLEGESLRALLNRVSKLDWKRALKIGIQVCEALDYAHKNGIVHRDLKPENIMLLHGTEPDFVKVLDFGLATIMPGSASDLQKLTATGKLLGSLRYMSPELFRGAKPDHRSDIYALACFIYESILGETPFKADSDFELIFQHANTSPKFFPTSGKTDLPPGIAGVLAKALQKEPSERYQNMADFKSDLQYLLDGKTEKLTVKEMQKSSWKSLFAPVLICFLTVFAIAFAVESVQNNTKHAQGVKAEKTPDLKTLPQARFFIRKGFQGNILLIALKKLS